MDVTKRDVARVLYAAAIALGRTRDAGEVVRVATAETQRALGAEAVALYLVAPDGAALVLREVVGPTRPAWVRMASLPLSAASLEARVLGEQRVVSTDVAGHPSLALRSALAEQGFGYVLAIPVAGRERPLGLLCVASREPIPLAGEEEVLVHAIGGLVGVALENAALREAMLEREERLRALASGILRSREEEARRIAHELHDEAGQLLASLHIAVDELAEQLPDRARTLRRLHERLDQVEAQLRRLSRELRPTILDDLGLAPALEWLAQGVAQRSGLAIAVDAPVGRLSREVETALYRVVQEALTNVARHAGATRVQVTIRDQGPVVQAVVQDDGRGFDVAGTLAPRGSGGLGLIGMQERVRALGGEVDVESTPGRGTRLSIAIPRGEAP